jgi:hypothetical protein
MKLTIEVCDQWWRFVTRKLGCANGGIYNPYMIYGPKERSFPVKENKTP